jgi:hypothetical protein
VLPNTIESVPLSVALDESIKTVFILLTNNWFVEGEKYYSASMRNRGRDIKITDFDIKLSEYSIDTDAFLFVATGTESDFKTPVAPERPSAQPPPETQETHTQQSRPPTASKNKIIILKWNEGPLKCSTCEKEEWLGERLNKMNSEISALKSKIKDEKKQNSSKAEKIELLTKQLDKKKSAESIALIGTALIAIGGLINTEQTRTMAFLFTLVGIVFAAVSLIVALFNINIPPWKKKGEHNNEQ